MISARARRVSLDTLWEMLIERAEQLHDEAVTSHVSDDVGGGAPNNSVRATAEEIAALCTCIQMVKQQTV